MLKAHTLLNLLLLLTCTCSRHLVSFSFFPNWCWAVCPFLFWWMICTYGSLRYYLYYIIHIIYIFEEWNKIDFKACRESSWLFFFSGPTHEKRTILQTCNFSFCLSSLRALLFYWLHSSLTARGCQKHFTLICYRHIFVQACLLLHKRNWALTCAVSHLCLACCNKHTNALALDQPLFFCVIILSLRGSRLCSSVSLAVLHFFYTFHLFLLVTRIWGPVATIVTECNTAPQ